MDYNDNHSRLSPEDPVDSKIFINKILSRLNIDLNSPEHVIATQWNVLVGENLCSNSKFCGIENGVMKVKCTNSSFASLFRMNSKEVIKNINSLFPELHINKINVHV